MAEARKSPTSRRRLVEREVLEKAAEVFARKGFAGTNLQDVADELGLSRGAIYYYYKDKDALLSALVEDVAVRAMEQVREMAKGDFASHAERLAAVVRSRTLGLLSRPNRMRLLVQSESDLPEPVASKHIKAKRQILDLQTELVQAGIDAGEFRPLDARMTAFALLGMVNWAAWWYQPEGRFSVEAIADFFVDCSLAMVLREPAEAGGAMTLGSAIARLRADLDRLERLAGIGEVADVRRSAP